MGHLPVSKPTDVPSVLSNHSWRTRLLLCPRSETRLYQQGSQEGGASFFTSWDKYSLQETGKKVPYCPAHCPQIQQGDIIASVGGGGAAVWTPCPDSGLLEDQETLQSGVCLS